MLEPFDVSKPLSCPFCGSVELIFQYGTEDREGTPVNVMCDSCSACGPCIYIDAKQDSEFAKVVAEWNNRVEVE